MANKTKVYAFVGPSGTGKSYRAQMVAGENDIHYIIDDGLLIRDNDVIAGVSAKKAPTKIETVKRAIFIDEKELIVGNHAEKPRCAPMFPEFGIFDQKELDLMPVLTISGLLVALGLVVMGVEYFRNEPREKKQDLPGQ